ncbi:MAG: type III pantothenate kinase [Gammaproteobacteria bacterium]|nr:MAG: type III pantothenate kinase [Gammaproteobacteria bacterium]
MILLLDAGNSRLKWARVVEGGFCFGGAIEREDRPPRVLFRALWSDLEPAPARMVVANVAGDSFRRSLTAWVRRRWGITPEYPRPQAQGFGIVNGYRDPERLGVDRWFALVAAARKVKKGAVCVIDCGTAMTIDAMDSRHRHLGGLILPGLRLMRETLVRHTEGIALQEAPALDEAAVAPLGRDTASGVLGGTLYAGVAMIERLLEELAAELGERVQAILTGGEAEAYLPLLRDRPQHAPYLVLEGLAWYARRTAQAQPARPRRGDGQEAAPAAPGADETATPAPVAAEPVAEQGEAPAGIEA